MDAKQVNSKPTLWHCASMLHFIGELQRSGYTIPEAKVKLYLSHKTADGWNAGAETFVGKLDSTRWIRSDDGPFRFSLWTADATFVDWRAAKGFLHVLIMNDGELVCLHADCIVDQTIATDGGTRFFLDERFSRREPTVEDAMAVLERIGQIERNRSAEV